MAYERGPWRMRYVFVMALVVAFVGLSSWRTEVREDKRIITATVTQWRPGESIAVANGQTDSQGFELRLRNTVYEGDTDTIEPGVRVTIWFQNVGERRLVADRVRVLDAAPH